MCRQIEVVWMLFCRPLRAVKSDDTGFVAIVTRLGDQVVDVRIPRHLLLYGCFIETNGQQIIELSLKDRGVFEF